MAKLVVQLASGRRREYELQKFNSIGRHPMQTIQVLDPQVSKEHLVIEQLVGGRWVLRDLGSLNGTLMNDKQVNGSIRVGHRDRVKVGTAEMVFIDASSAATGDHRVSIVDNVESSISTSLDGASEFLPVDAITDDVHLRRDYEKLRLALALHQEVGAELRLDTLLPRILEHLLDLFQADRGVCLLRDQTTGEMATRAVRVKAGQSAEQIALSETILQRVQDDKQAVLTSDAMRDDRFSGAHSVILHGLRSTMCVPLIGRKGDVSGVIHLDSTKRINAFGERDLQVLQGVAQQAAIAIENSQLVERIEAEAKTRQRFEKMLSPNLVERVVSGELQIKRGGELRQVTIMFTDIRGFTDLGERTPPRELVKMLNEYFEIVVDVVFEFYGTIDKYIGDSVMALWGAPVEDPDGPRRTVSAAVEIQRAMTHFNQLRELDGLSPILTGIGIDTGEIVAGYMGSSKTMNYTVVGPSVNLASRLCSQARGGEILVSAQTYSEVADVVRATPRPPLRLKGISEVVHAYTVHDIGEFASVAAETPTGRVRRVGATKPTTTRRIEPAPQDPSSS